MRQQKIYQSQQEDHIPFQHNSEVLQARKIRIQKNRAIRKSKVIARRIAINQSIDQSMNIIPVSRQQRAQIQKLKNRQAAQKSRQQKKAYVQNLQDQIAYLKEKLNRPNYCQNCGKQVSYGNNDSTFLESPMDLHHEDTSQFIRVPLSRKIDPIQMFLLISMIAVAIFCFSGVSTGEQQSFARPRQLLQLHQQQFTFADNMQTSNIPGYRDSNPYNLNQNIQSANFKRIQNNYQKRNPELIPPNKSLQPLKYQQCYKKIIDQNNKNQTKYHEGLINLRQNYKASNNNLLFCQIPRIYRNNDDKKGVFSNFLDIVVSGAQMMELINYDDKIGLRNIFNLDGMYQLKAQIHEIIKLESFQNCII